MWLLTFVSFRHSDQNLINRFTKDLHIFVIGVYGAPQLQHRMCRSAPPEVKQLGQKKFLRMEEVVEKYSVQVHHILIIVRQFQCLICCLYLTQFVLLPHYVKFGLVTIYQTYWQLDFAILVRVLSKNSALSEQRLAHQQSRVFLSAGTQATRDIRTVGFRFSWFLLTV